MFSRTINIQKKQCQENISYILVLECGFISAAWLWFQFCWLAQTIQSTSALHRFLCTFFFCLPLSACLHQRLNLPPFKSVKDIRLFFSAQETNHLPEGQLCFKETHLLLLGIIWVPLLRCTIYHNLNKFHSGVRIFTFIAIDSLRVQESTWIIVDVTARGVWLNSGGEEENYNV